MSGENIPRMSGGGTEIHVQRHDDHNQGHLTPEGHIHARQLAYEKAGSYLDKDSRVHFMVIASDQVIDDREPQFGGIRAHETAEEVTTAIRQSLEERGLPQSQLFDSSPDSITSNPILREAGIFSNDFMKHLREQYPEDNPWRLYYQDIDQQTREELGAESPYDLAQRMDYVVKSAELAGAIFHSLPGNEQIPLIVWMVGHGGGLDSYLHHYAGVPQEQLGFGFSDGFSLRSTDEGKTIIADVKGIEYKLNPDTFMSLPG